MARGVSPPRGVSLFFPSSVRAPRSLLVGCYARTYTVFMGLLKRAIRREDEGDGKGAILKSVIEAAKNGDLQPIRDGAFAIT